MSANSNEINLIIHTLSRDMDENSFKSLFSYNNKEKINITLVGLNNNYSTNLNLNKVKKYYFISTECAPTEKEAIYSRKISKIIGKKNSFYMDFECCAHPSHIKKWELDTYKYFSKVYNSYYKIIDNEKYKWIPGYLWTLGYFPKKQDIEEYNKYGISLNPTNKKIKFMINNPINGSNSIRNYLILSFLINCINEKEVFNFYGREEHILNYLKHFNLENYKYTPCSDELYNENERNVDDLSTLCKKKIAIFTWYKFILTIENNPDTYMSEKFIDCLYSNSVPVYFGQENMTKILPDIFTNGVINGWDFFTKEEQNELVQAKSDLHMGWQILSQEFITVKSDKIDNGVNKIIKYLKNMSQEEYDLRIENIKKYRDKYFQIFHIGPIYKYIYHNGIKEGKELNLLNEEELEQYNLFEEISERLVLNKSKNRKADGKVEKFIEDYVKNN